MELLAADQFLPEPDDVVHSEGVLARAAVLVVLMLAGWALLAVPLIAGPWGFLAWPVGLCVVAYVALAFAGVGRGFHSDHWAVRLRPKGIALRLRSYLNDDLPSDGPTVCWIPSSEIRWVRRGRTQRLLPGSKQHQLLVEQHLDILLAHDQTQGLADALTREHSAPRRGRARHHVYPVRLARPDLVRVTWSDAHLTLRPGLEPALAFLKRHVRIESPLEQAIDFRKLTDEETADLARDLVRMGSRMRAIELLRARGGLDLARAKQLVDEIALEPLSRSPP